MKYVDGNSWYDAASREWKQNPRKYTDFYCSLSEWKNLGRGKSNFMYQVRSVIVDILGYPDIKEVKDDYIWSSKNEKITLKNGLVVNKLSFDRHGRRDSTVGEEWSAWIIKNVIKLITHRDANVEFYSWKGTIDHIEISFENCSMPNIIVLVDEYGGSTNNTLIACIDAIYDALNIKVHPNYERGFMHMFNSDYDFLCFQKDYYYDTSKSWWWDERFYRKDRRIYDDYYRIRYKK